MIEVWLRNADLLAILDDLKIEISANYRLKKISNHDQLNKTENGSTKILRLQNYYLANGFCCF